MMFLFERKNSGSKHLTDLRESFQRVDLVQGVCECELMFQIWAFMHEIKPKTFTQAEYFHVTRLQGSTRISRSDLRSKIFFVKKCPNMTHDLIT